jgi:hypothetical protein
MKILTKENAGKPLGGKSLDAFIARLYSQLQLVEGAYSAPLRSGKQIALSKLFAYWMLKDSPVCLYVTCWGVGTEHLDLFYGYRRSLGENRPLIEAPVHLFERTDEDAFISILCMVFFFSWDASVFDTAGRSLLQTSHDGWLEVRTNDEELAKDVAVEMENYRVPLLAQ